MLIQLLKYSKFTTVLIALTACGGSEAPKTEPAQDETSSNTAPTSQGFSVSLDEDTSAGFTFNGIDAESDSLSVIIVTAPLNGEVTLNDKVGSYTPDANFFGNDSFEFSFSDGELSSEVYQVAITVNPANDIPTGTPQEVSSLEDEAITFTLGVSDVEDSNLSISITNNPSHGDISIEGISVTYTPAMNFTGTDSFTYTATDGESTSESIQVVINTTPLNDIPEIANQSVSVNENDSVLIALNGSDADGDQLTYELTSAPSYGDLQGDFPNVTYTPNIGFEGQDTLSVRAFDGLVYSEPADVQITVVPSTNLTFTLSEKKISPAAADEEVAKTYALLYNEDLSEIEQTIILNANENFVDFGEIERESATVAFVYFSSGMNVWNLNSNIEDPLTDVSLLVDTVVDVPIQQYDYQLNRDHYWGTARWNYCDKAYGPLSITINNIPLQTDKIEISPGWTTQDYDPTLEEPYVLSLENICGFADKNGVVSFIVKAIGNDNKQILAHHYEHNFQLDSSIEQELEISLIQDSNSVFWETNNAQQIDHFVIAAFQRQHEFYLTSSEGDNIEPRAANGSIDYIGLPENALFSYSMHTSAESQENNLHKSRGAWAVTESLEGPLQLTLPSYIASDFNTTKDTTSWSFNSNIDSDIDSVIISKDEFIPFTGQRGFYLISHRTVLPPTRSMWKALPLPEEFENVLAESDGFIFERMRFEGSSSNENYNEHLLDMMRNDFGTNYTGQYQTYDLPIRPVPPIISYVSINDDDSLYSVGTDVKVNAEVITENEPPFDREVVPTLYSSNPEVAYFIGDELVFIAPGKTLVHAEYEGESSQSVVFTSICNNPELLMSLDTQSQMYAQGDHVSLDNSIAICGETEIDVKEFTTLTLEPSDSGTLINQHNLRLSKIGEVSINGVITKGDSTQLITESQAIPGQTVIQDAYINCNDFSPVENLSHIMAVGESFLPSPIFECQFSEPNIINENFDVELRQDGLLIQNDDLTVEAVSPGETIITVTFWGVVQEIAVTIIADD